ncbi:FMN-linked oxidoreductase [Vararia minispora EC-137]|uniref:FMN-linked oxidoreductase n=1 Tax=Vararia minispora EC-137 TaxID=1314806 RepID=A0ACB8QRZ2_9AGAM|nr:FMN-linked oxidoreductase [Vararia minispora EC-137]
MSHSLFQPIQLGRYTLQHRVVMPALTRNRALNDHAVDERTVEHYAARAAVPGTLLITEATFVARRNAGIPNWATTPGIWSAEQIQAWKKAFNAVHAQKSVIFLQLWANGRDNDPDLLALRDPSFSYTSASDVPRAGISRAPRPLTHDEIQALVHDFGAAAKAAVNEAGFDGVEFHAAGGRLIDEFFKRATNLRTDEYGGSIENRSRFYLEILGEVVEAVGADRVGVKIAPWVLGSANAGKEGQDDPRPVFTYAVNETRKRHPKLAYLHVLEPRSSDDPRANDFLRNIWAGKPYISDGGYTRETAITRADKDEKALVSFGRYYTSNPDLPIRLEYNIPLTPYDRASFYFDVEGSHLGYNTFEFSEESRRILEARRADHQASLRSVSL